MEPSHSIRSPSVGSTLLAGPFRVRLVDYPASFEQLPHSHDVSSVTLFLSGAVRERTRREEREGSALSVVTKPAGTRHADEFGPRGARTLQVAFDPDRVKALPELGVGVARWRWRHAEPAVVPLVALARAMSRHRGLTGGEWEDLVLEALAALEEGEGDEGCGWLARVKEALDDDPFSERSVRDLAGLVGAHPVSVSRAFRRTYGVTVTEYRRRWRLRRAAELAAQGAMTLSGLAHAVGYADHSHMCRDFRALVGVSPSTYRSLASG